MQEGRAKPDLIDILRTTANDIPVSDRQSLVELKNGRATLKQKIVSFEKQSETLQEIVKFRAFLESRIERKDSPLPEIPHEHRPLIAKMAHESDKTLSALAKHIRQELLPTTDIDAMESSADISDALPLSVVEVAIKLIMNRNNYGLNPPNGGKAPAAICIWRWEVKEEHRDWLPKSGREKAEQRLAERTQAKQDLQTMFNALSQEEQLAIMDPKAAVKLQLKTPNDENQSESLIEKSGKEAKLLIKENQDDDAQMKAGRPKKAPDPEKLAREKEKLDKRAARAEKEKREKDAQNKSRSIMANFFSKKVPITKPTTLGAMNSKAGPSDTQSEFSKAFKPFVIKKDVQLAPSNWFSSPRSKSKGKYVVRNLDEDVITIDDADDTTNDVIMGDPYPPVVDVSEMNSKDRLRSILSTLPPPLDASRAHPPTDRRGLYKTYYPNSIRDIMAGLTEAEVAGDDGLVRFLLSKLRNRTAFPSKVIIFHEDARPGYFGTRTRNSKMISARTPFAKDLVGIDYNYDSGEEWEDEGTGDVVDEDDEEPVDEDADSDLDSWLVDDDDIDVNIDDSDLSPPDVPEHSPKRKVENEEKKSCKRRKAVVPLVPFAKGPCWESTIGHCDYDPFKAYQIRLLNDTPFPIDPFKFVSTDVENKEPRPAGHSSDGLSLPDGSTNATISAIPKRLTVAPKNALPDTYLPFLLTKITSLQAASITFLVEAIYQELRVHKVKKNAIEAKVREVGEKCKERKVWVVKSAFKPEDTSS